MSETRTWGRKTAWRVRIAERRSRAIELRAAGCSWQGIADELGYCSRGAACQDVSRALAEIDRRQRESATAARQLRAEIEPLLLARWWPLTDTGDIWGMFCQNPTGVLDALNTLSACLEADDQLLVGSRSGGSVR